MTKEVYLDEGLQGWIAKTAYEQHWRVRAWYDVQDLIQDGFLCYVKCRNRYTLGPPAEGHTALNTDNPTPLQRKHFASLVMVAFTNHIMTLASRFALQKESAMSELLEDDSADAVERLIPHQQQEDASLRVLLSKAPAEITEAITKIMNDSKEGGDYLRTKLFSEGTRVRRGRTSIRETTRQRWQRILGDPDLPQRVVDYITQA